ncbi:MAG: DUF3160 domain-containing protein [Thermodesulfobacteriota bacterium]|nr:DUF3160 domain-containing protein [Thermodesulfobacteriota bacterium]
MRPRRHPLKGDCRTYVECARLCGSKHELENTELLSDDRAFINDFADRLNGLIAEVGQKATKTSMVADVHRDSNTMQVLEESLGYVKLRVVALRVPDGRILVGVGLVHDLLFVDPLGA